MRLAIFTPFLYPFHIDLLNEIRKRVDAKLFACGIYGNYPFEELLKHAEKLRCIDIAGQKLIEPISLAKFINYKPNATIIFGIEGLAGLEVYFLSRLLRVKTLVIVEENYITKLDNIILQLLQNIKRSIISLVYQHAPILVAESFASKKYVLDILHIKRKKPIIVHVHGINIDRFRKLEHLPKSLAKEYAIKILGLQDRGLIKKIWCTFIGEPLYCKGIDILIDAIEILQGILKPSIKIVFLLPQRELLRDKKELKAYYGQKLVNLIKKNIVVLYKPIEHEKISLLYRASDVIILPSRLLNNASSDRSPNVAIEALISGTLLIASYVGGIPTIVKDGGILIKPNDPYTLAMKLYQVVNNYKKYKQLAEKGRIRAMREFDMRHYAHILLKLLMSSMD